MPRKSNPTAEQKPALPVYSSDKPVDIPASGTWPRSVHQFEPETIAALKAAEITGRPLLLRGDPGNGKSQTARAAAVAGNRPFLSVVIDGRTEPHDLLWRFDAVARLADAQVRKEGEALHEEAAYLVPGPLWWAYAWNSAAERLAALNCTRKRSLQPLGTAPEGWNADEGRAVLLIDEIDKADPDLPNALLEVLANLGFREPYGGEEIRCSEATRPLVILTTNEERELPHAFLRRCMVHSLHLPDAVKERDALVARLQRLGEQHQARLRPGERCHVLKEAAGQVAEERARLAGSGRYLPGTSEYLDLVNAVSRLARTKKQQVEALAEIGGFALKKSGPRGR